MPTPVNAALQTFLGGMNGNIDPRLLQLGTYAFGLNLTSRGGLPKTRPTFTDSGFSIATGKFQGAFTYSLNDADRIVYGIAGSVYSLNLSTGVITNHGSLLSSTVDRFFFVKADRYCIIQDGDKSTSYADANWPVILDGDTRIDQGDASVAQYYEANEYERVPKGGPMAYGHGRLFVATDYVLEDPAQSWLDKGRVGYMAGDIILQHRPESILEFKETWSLDSGGRFGLPEELGFIYHMDFQHNIMSGVGQGPLMVFADNGASIYMVNAPRSNWTQIDFSVVLFSGVGTNSPLSFVRNNSDILFRGTDGFRTVAQATQELQGTNLANKAISSEVSVVTDQDTIAFLPKVSAVKHDNRIFFTSVPDSTGFKALVSLDVDAVSSISTPAQPIYDGIWTGLEWLHVLQAEWNGADTLFAFTIASDDSQRLVYLDSTAYQDLGSSSPTVRLYTPYQFFESPFDLKRFEYAHLWVSDVRGQVTFTLYYRIDGYPLWSKMSSATVNSAAASPKMKYSKIRFTPSAVSKEPRRGETLDSGFGIQFCVEWTGSAKCDMMQFHSDLIGIDRRNIGCKLDGDLDTIVADDNAIELDDYEYRVE